MLDPIAYVLGDILTFIYNTISFHNYGLAIIIFTIIVRLALLPLTLKQYKSSAKMQEIQPLIADIQRRYKDDKEKLNQEMMKVYQENGYNPASGCLPILIQMPILITLYYVIIEPLKFMLDKDKETVAALADVAAKGLNKTIQTMGIQKDLLTLNYFNEHKDKLSLVGDKLKASELIDFNNFLGLHLGKTADWHPKVIFGAEAYIYLPLFILAILAVVTTFISSKLAMPSPNNSQGNNSQQNAMANSMTNSMLYIGPLMTLMFSFQLPAGVVLYWMAGYIVAIAQQLYINRFVLKKHLTPEQRALESAREKEKAKARAAIAAGTAGQIGTADNATETESKPQDSSNEVKTAGNTGKGGSNANSGNKKSGSGKNKKGGSGSSYMGKKK